MSARRRDDNIRVYQIPVISEVYSVKRPLSTGRQSRR
jgi:hypothetical protein